MKREAFSLRKLKRLCALLKVPHYAGVGILESLWQVTARDAPAGDIGRLTDEEIAHEIDWRGGVEKLIEALCDPGCTWLDRHHEHRLLVHDWPDHADDMVHRRLARNGQLFADGSVPKLTKLTQAEREAAEGRFLRGSAARRAPAPDPGRPPGAHPAPKVPPPGADTSPAGRVPCLALPSQTLPAAAGEVGDGEKQSDQRESDAEFELCARAVEQLYPDRPGGGRPDMVAVRAALSRRWCHLPAPRAFAERILLWRLSGDWYEQNGRFIPLAHLWIDEKKFKTVPLDRSGSNGMHDGLWARALKRALSIDQEPQAVSA